MKRLLAVILAALITVTLASCLSIPDIGGTKVPNDGLVYSPDSKLYKLVAPEDLKKK